MEEHEVEAVAMRLANRAYLHRMFHIAFGAEPSAEELAVLGGREAADALRFAADACRADGSAEGASAGMTLGRAADLAVSLGGKQDDAAHIDSLKTLFTKLFLVPGDAYVHPWESPYVGKEVMLFQESTLDVRHRFLEHGFTAVEFGHFPEDHVAMMLDFLGHLSQRAFEAFGDGNDAEVARILRSQADFMEVHLLNWLPLFCDKLRTADDGGVFSGLADALLAFLAADARFAERLAADLEAGA